MSYVLCVEFEMPLGHPTCQAVGQMRRKLREQHHQLRGEVVKNMPSLSRRPEAELWRHQYQRAKERQGGLQKN